MLEVRRVGFGLADCWPAPRAQPATHEPITSLRTPRAPLGATAKQDEGAIAIVPTLVGLYMKVDVSPCRRLREREREREGEKRGAGGGDRIVERSIRSTSSVGVSHLNSRSLSARLLVYVAFRGGRYVGVWPCAPPDH